MPIKTLSKDDATKAMYAFATLPNIGPATGDGATKARRFSGIGYSGKVIPNHSWWGNVIFDLSSIQQPPKAFAALVNHDGDKIAGYIDEFELSDAEGVKIGGPLIYADGYQGKYVADGSDAGFPWQMSVCIKPGSIEEVAAGTPITVNGQMLQGPLTVFRNSTLSEVSFTPTGWDSNTSAAAMSRANQQDQPPQLPDEGNTMTAQEQAEFDKAKADAAAATLRASQLEASLTTTQEQLKAIALTQRTSAVTQLFSDTKREFKADSAEVKTLMEMPEASFSVVAGLMRSQAPVAEPTPAARTGLNPALFSTTAEQGKEKDAPVNVAKDGQHGLVAHAMSRNPANRSH